MSVYVAGLTGQSGAGKTTVSRAFSDCGFYVIDCDIVARRVTEAGTESARSLERQFPEFFDDGVLNRRRTAELLFSDSELLCRYNAAIFPFINDAIEREIAAAEKSGEKLILLDAPTLFEAGADRLCDTVAGITAETELRVRRITARDGISEQQARARIASQHSEEFFRERCEYIIENNGTLEETSAAAVNVALKIKEIANGRK